MLLIINASKLNGGCSNSMQTLLEEKLSFLENFIKEDEQVKVVFEKTKRKFKGKIYVVLKDNYHTRVETTSENFNELVDELKDDLFDVIKRHNHSKKQKKIRNSKKEKEKAKNRRNFTVNKRKKFLIEEMSEDEAMDRLEELGHDSFMFKNVEKDGATCLIYKKWNGYGIIESE